MFPDPQTVDPARPAAAYAPLLPATPLGGAFDDAFVGALLGAP